MCPSPILWDVLEEHLDEAEFLWSSWETALDSSMTPLQVVDGPEERLIAHLHALYLGGATVARRLLEPALASASPGKAFAAAHALLARGDERRVLQALHAAGDEARPGIVRALELHDRRELVRSLLPLAASGVAGVQAAALAILAFQRSDPGDALRAAGSSRDPAVLAAALTAARTARAGHGRQLVLGALSSPLAEVREAAIEAGLVLGLRDAWQACRAHWTAEPSAPRASLLVAMGGDAKDHEAMLGALAADPSPAALRAAGYSGRLAAADACVAAMSSEDRRVARVAGEAFSAITGLELEGRFAAEEPPEVEEPIPFEEEDLDAELVPSPDDALPLPEPEAVQEWWQAQRTAFHPTVRYLRGKPFGLEAIREELQRGPMRRRHALALELEIRTRGAAQVGSRRWVRAQRVALDGVGADRLGASFARLATEG